MAEDHRFSFFDEADEALWTGPARRTDLFRTEEVVLFCYLWTIWRRQASPFNPRLADEASSKRSADCDSVFAALEAYCHVSVFDALSTLARMIVHELWLYEGTLGHGDDVTWHYDDIADIMLTAEEVRRYKATLAGRLVLGARRLQESPDKTSFELFLQAYAAPVPSKADYFSEKPAAFTLTNLFDASSTTISSFICHHLLWNGMVHHLNLNGLPSDCL